MNKTIKIGLIFSFLSSSLQANHSFPEEKPKSIIRSANQPYLDKALSKVTPKTLGVLTTVSTLLLSLLVGFYLFPNQNPSAFRKALKKQYNTTDQNLINHRLRKTLIPGIIALGIISAILAGLTVYKAHKPSKKVSFKE